MPTRIAARRWAMRLGVLAILGAALVAPATTRAAEPATQPTTAPTTEVEPTCTGSWPAALQGKPAVYKAGAPAGDYIWFDERGWHLRVTKVTSAPAVFGGRIRSDVPMAVSGVLLERGDAFSLSADKRTLTYRFTNRGHIDGLEIKVECGARLMFGGSMNGAALPVRRIWLGADGVHPLQNPFVVLRVD